MGEVINFGERRRNFMKGIQLTGTNRVSYIGDRTRFKKDTPEIRRKHRRLRAAAEYYDTLPENERVWMDKRRIAREEKGVYEPMTIKGIKREHKIYTGRKRLMSVAILLGGGALAIAMLDGANTYKNSQLNINSDTQDRVPLEQVIGNQDELARLGISNETATEIQNLYSELNSADIENLSEEEVLGLGSRVEDIQFDTMKEKIANEMGVPVESIELRVSYTDHVPKASAIIDGKGYNEGDFLDHNDNISGEMADYIEKIAGTQSTNSRLEEGSITKQDALEQYRGAMESVRDVSTKELSIDGNGNMSLSQVSRADIDKAMEDEEER